MDRSKENEKSKASKIPVSTKLRAFSTRHINDSNEDETKTKRAPLRTLAFHSNTNADNCLAGPSKPLAYSNTNAANCLAGPSKPLAYNNTNADNCLGPSKPLEYSNTNADKCLVGLSKPLAYNNTNADNCLAGPSEPLASNTSADCRMAGPSKPLDARKVALRNHKIPDLKFSVKEKHPKNLEINENITNKQVATSSRAVDNTLSLVGETQNFELKEVKKTLKKPHFKDSESRSSPFSAQSPDFVCLESRHIECESLFYPTKEYVYENLVFLQETEKKLVTEPNIRGATRACVVNWMIKVNGSKGDQAIIQQACWYLDNYLSSTLVTTTKLQVIAAACYWTAAKYHGLQVQARRLVKYAGHAFVKDELLKAEKNVLRKLNFQLDPRVPQDFVAYLSWWCDEARTGAVEHTAVFLCQCGLLADKSLIREYPSVIAAAAVKTALELLQRKKWIADLETCHVYTAAKKKTSNISEICTKLSHAARLVVSVDYEYNAPLMQFSIPPYFNIANKIIETLQTCKRLKFDIEK